jgi:hypothetical protein
MMDGTEIFWQHFYKGAGVTLGLLRPLLLGFGALMLAVFRQQHRHEAAMPEARRRAAQVRESRVRIIQGGQG